MILNKHIIIFIYKFMLIIYVKYNTLCSVSRTAARIIAFTLILSYIHGKTRENNGLHIAKRKKKSFMVLLVLPI